MTGHSSAFFVSLGTLAKPATIEKIMDASKGIDIATLSLIVAALAVVVTPAASWFIATRKIRSSLEITNKQIRSSLEAANKQIVAPMRQAWINKLRELLADFTGRTHHYWNTTFAHRSENEYQDLVSLQAHIVLMLNPTEEDHQDLEKLMRKMVVALLEDDVGPQSEYPGLHGEMLALTRKILKTEWNRVRKPMMT